MAEISQPLITKSSWKINLRRASLDLTDDYSPLGQVMAWCRQATSHYLSKSLPRSPYGVIRPQGRYTMPYGQISVILRAARYGVNVWPLNLTCVVTKLLRGLSIFRKIWLSLYRISWLRGLITINPLSPSCKKPGVIRRDYLYKPELIYQLVIAVYSLLFSYSHLYSPFAQCHFDIHVL